MKGGDPDAQLPDLATPIAESDHRIGPARAKFSLVEYIDYECPHSAHLQPIVRELIRELGDDLCVVARHFPLPEIHPHANRAAEAAEAADMQAKFWLMHDRLFEHQLDLSDATIHRLARELPLEMDTFDRDLRSGAAARRVAEDREGGLAAGVEGTPTLFLNGRMHVGSYEFLPLLRALRGER